MWGWLEKEEMGGDGGGCMVMVEMVSFRFFLDFVISLWMVVVIVELWVNILIMSMDGIDLRLKMVISINVSCVVWGLGSSS